MIQEHSPSRRSWGRPERCILLLLAACHTTPAQPSLATEVLARHVLWSGGDRAWEAVRDLDMVGTLAVSGLRGSLAVRMTRAGLVGQSYDLGVVRGADGVDAQGGWRQNQSGQIEGLGEDEVARHRGQVRRAFGEHLRPEARAKATYVGREQCDGVDYDVVRFPGEAGGEAGEVDFLFAADGALAFVRAQEGDTVRETAFSDHRVVAGLKIPHRQVVRGTETQVIEWTSVRANIGLEAADLARPQASRAVGTLAPGEVLDLPLDLYLDCYAFVRGEVNGKEADIVLDSGAGITVVDRELADALGLQGAGEVVAQGVGGHKRKVALAKASVRLGALELRDLTVAILDLTEVHERLGRRMPLILGKELFHAFTVTFDYPQRRLRVYDAASFAAPAGAVACEARPLDDGHVMIQVEFEDLGPAWLMVDTGAGDTLALHAGYVEKHGLLSRYAKLGDRRIGGVGGSLPAKMATANRVGLAGQTFPDVPVTLATEGKGAFASTKSDGNLGAELMSRFVVTFDYARRRLLFTPGPAMSRPFVKERSGLVLDRQGGKIVVTAVSAGSPAAAAGVQAGSVLVAIDGHDLTQASSSGVLRQALRQPAGTVLRIRDDKGEEHAITLADYF